MSVLTWEMNLPDEHGISADTYEVIADEDAGLELELDIEWSEPNLLLTNDRAYRALRRFLSIVERDSRTGLLHLEYEPLRDCMLERGCTARDRERIFDAWAALRNRDAETQQTRSGPQAADWEAQKKRFGVNL